MANWYNGDIGYAVKGSGSVDAFQESEATGEYFGERSATGSGDTGKAEDVESKLIHRFRLKFGVFNNIGQHVKTITKPNVTFAEIEVPKLNSKVYFAGRKTQDQTTVEVDDAIDNNVTKAVQTQLQKQANFDTNYHAKSAAAYFFNMTAEELIGDGSPIMAWYYNKCVVMTCDFGTLDYSDDAGTSTINLGIRYANFTTWMGDLTSGVEEGDDTYTTPPEAGGLGN